MTVIVAYDGSDYSEAAMDDWKMAGLPRKGHALIVSVLDSMSPDSLSNNELVERAVSSLRILPTLTVLQNQTSDTLIDLKRRSAAVAKKIKRSLPRWSIESMVSEGVPIETLLHEADRRKAELIIAGSHGRSALGRFFLGSVSTELARRATCSVRIVPGKATKHHDIKPRVIVASSRASKGRLASECVKKRLWNELAEVRLVWVDDGFSSPLEADNGVAMALRASGVRVSATTIGGDPRTSLPEEADRWGANSIFLPAEGEIGVGLRWEDVWASLLIRADYAVEIVRLRP